MHAPLDGWLQPSSIQLSRAAAARWEQVEAVKQRSAARHTRATNWAGRLLTRLTLRRSRPGGDPSVVTPARVSPNLNHVWPKAVESAARTQPPRPTTHRSHP